MELIAKLGIDIKLLIAQIINFLILLAILYKFAYKPVFNMLESRQKKIEKGMKDAEKSEQLLKEVEQTRADALAKIKEQHIVMMEKISKEAEILKQEMLAHAKEEARKLFQLAKDAIEREKRQMMHELREEVVKLAILTAEKVLEREFRDEDQKRLMERLTEEVTVK